MECAHPAKPSLRQGAPHCPCPEADQRPIWSSLKPHCSMHLIREARYTALWHHSIQNSKASLSGYLCALLRKWSWVVPKYLRMHSAHLQGESKSQLSQADLVLRGHTEDAKFAVAISSAEPLVASGGDDTQVCRSLGSSGPIVRVTAAVEADWQ